MCHTFTLKICTQVVVQRSHHQVHPQQQVEAPRWGLHGHPAKIHRQWLRRRQEDAAAQGSTHICTCIRSRAHNNYIDDVEHRLVDSKVKFGRRRSSHNVVFDLYSMLRCSRVCTEHCCACRSWWWD